VLSDEIDYYGLHEMFNSNFTFIFDEVDKNLLIVFPILNDISFGREKSTKADIMLKFIVQTIGQLVFIKNLLNNFIVFQLILGEAVKDRNDFLYSSRVEA